MTVTATQADAMAFLSWAAYDNSSSDASVIRTATDNLSGSGWSVETPAVDTGTYDHEFYVNGPAAALVATKGDAIAIAFRGTDGSKLQDLFAGGFDQTSYFQQYSDFLESVELLAQQGGYTHLYVTGHSLGGIMAQWFAVEYGAAFQSLGLDVSIATFGDPGVLPGQFPTPQDQASADLLAGIVNFGHTEDNVFTLVSLERGLTRNGTDILVDLPGISNGVADYWHEHNPALYQQTVSLLDQSGWLSNVLSAQQAPYVVIDVSGSIGALTSGSSDLGPTDPGMLFTPQVILGLAGDDTLHGGYANDILDGGSGNDSLSGNGGNDLMKGGPNADTFAFDGSAYSGLNSTYEVEILDYNQGNNGSWSPVEGDTLDVSGVLFNTSSGYADASRLRAIEDVSGTFATFQMNPSGGSDDAAWYTIAQLDGVAAGKTLDIVVDPSSPKVAVAVQPPAGEAPATWQISPDQQTVGENGGTVTFTVTRSASTTEQTVYISTTINHGSYNDGDYAYWLNVPHTFAAGKSTYDVTVQINQDTLAESDETFGLIVQQSPADPASKFLASATFTIIDDDTPPSPVAGVTWTSSTNDHYFSGTAGNDTATGSSGNNTLYGNDGNDHLYGGSGNDYLSGGAGNDYLSDTGGNNTLLGGAGNDNIYVSGSGSNTIDGGDGIDMLSLYRPDLTVPATVNDVSDGNGSTYAFTLPDGTSVNNIELLNLTTGSGDDTVTFANTTIAGTQSFNGGAGNDTAIVDFSAFSSKVTAQPYSGSTTYYIGSQSTGAWTWAYEVMLTNVENVTIYGGAGDDYLYGASGSSTLIGNDGNDYIEVRSGNNTLLGGAGDDRINVSGSGTNIIDGGDGIDTLTLVRTDLTTPVTASTGSFTWADGTSVSNIELLNLTTGSGDDTVTFANTTIAGTQSFNGGAGNDTAIVDFSAFSSKVTASTYYSNYFIGTGPYVSSYPYYSYEVWLTNVENVTISGGAGNDFLDRTSAGGNNTLYGNDGNDDLRAGSGNDYLSGGAGNDYLSDTGGNNTLLGGAGDDNIYVSGSGSNTIDGGDGVDTLTFYRPTLTDPATVNVVSDGDGSTYAFTLPDGTSVSNVELLNLTTGSGDDTVTFANTTIAGTQSFNGGAGNDTAIVDFSAFSSKVTASTYYSNYFIGTGPYVSSYPYYSYEVWLTNVENVTISGGAGNDSLDRTSAGGNNTLYGNDGNDDLRAGSGNDYLSGGAGNDYLSDTGGNNTLLGGAGDDNIYVSGSGSNTIDGGDGVDTLTFYRPTLTDPATVNVVSDGDGSTYAFTLPDGTSVSNVELLNLTTGSGDDTVTFANTTIAGTQSFNGGAGNDTAIVDFSAFSSKVTASTYYSNYFIGTGPYVSSYPYYSYEVWLTNVENVTISGGAGNDSLDRTSAGGNNTLYGNDGNDDLRAGSGNDYLSGGAGNDYLSDTGGNNTLLGGAGDDNI